MITRRPDDLDDVQAAAITDGGLLAVSCLRKARIERGDEVLIYGASGAVGTSAAQLARLFGARVTGVCSTSNLELVKALGAQDVIDYTETDVTASDRRFDVVVDAVGRRKSAAALRERRRILTKDGTFVSVDDGRPDFSLDDLAALVRWAASGRLQPVVDRIYALDDVVEAHRYVDGGHKRGNVVVLSARRCGLGHSRRRDHRRGAGAGHLSLANPIRSRPVAQWWPRRALKNMSSPSGPSRTSIAYT